MAAKQSALERIFILPFVLLLLCLESTIAWVLHRSAQETADTISDTVLIKTADYLRNAVQENLSYARIVKNAVAPDTVLQREFMQDQLWTALCLFPESGRQVLFSSKSGGATSESRESTIIVMK